MELVREQTDLGPGESNSTVPQNFKCSSLFNEDADSFLNLWDGIFPAQILLYVFTAYNIR